MKVRNNMEKKSRSGASSISSNGLLHSVGVGWGSGSSRETDQGESSSNANQKQSAKSIRGSSSHYIAVLEADLKLFEITLDSVSPNDLSSPFLRDFIKLPSSYYKIGADVELQSFVLRYGTHYIRSSKFGGQLQVIKTSTSESSMSQEEFAETAENEFGAIFFNYLVSV